jgi:hypothetical protein
LKLRDVLIVGGILLLAGVAAADSLLRDDSPGPTADAPSRTTTRAGRDPILGRERFPPTRAPGSVVFLEGDACVVRQVVASSGDELPLEKIATGCALWAPPRGVRIAYQVGSGVGDWVHFRFLDLNHPQADLGASEALLGRIAWSSDGQRAAWCVRTDDGASGVDVEVGSREGFRRTSGCPREYTDDGEPVYVSGRRVFARDRREPLFDAGGPVWLVHRGTDGSYGVFADGRRLERYEDGRLRETRLVRPSVAGSTLSFAPDNCAVLANREGVVAVIDLGCFRGADAVTTVSPDNCVDRAEATKSECARYPAPRAFEGTAAAWSPDGEWIAVAEANALAFHRLVGRYAVVRWPAEPRAVAWLG